MTEGVPPVAVYIPARLGSSRFPGKPLIELAGKPLIQHVYEAATRCSLVQHVEVVTDDADIRRRVEAFGGHASMVTEPCRSGTDRVAKRAVQENYDIIVNLQADEIPSHPGVFQRLIESFLASEAIMGTLKRPLEHVDQLTNRAVVKVVTDHQGRALYFSRSPIPCGRDYEPRDLLALAFMHLGIYIFRREALLRFTELPTGTLEDLEKLEQLRALEYGMPIQVWETAFPSIRIDEARDVDAARQQLEQPTPSPR